MEALVYLGGLSNTGTTWNPWFTWGRLANAGTTWKPWFTWGRLANEGKTWKPWPTWLGEPSDAPPDTDIQSASSVEQRQRTRKSDDIAEGLVTSQAFTNLLSQLNISKYAALYSKNNSRVSYDVQKLIQCVSINLEATKFDQYSARNRHVLKVCELIDAWLALVSGEQFKYMSELTQEKFWKDVCSGDSETTRNDPLISLGSRQIIQNVHAEVEKRRLHYNLLNEKHRFEHTDQYITFMGYRMETIRSELATCVKDTHHNVDEDEFKPRVQRENTIKPKIRFSRDVSILLMEDFKSNSERRGLQTRILWELQNALVEECGHGPDCPDTMALCVLSFPSMRFSSKFQDMFGTKSNQHLVAVPASGSGGGAPSAENSNRLETNQSATLLECGLRDCPRHCCIPISHSSPDRQQSSSSQSINVNSSIPDLFVHILGGPQPCQIRIRLDKSGLNEVEASLSIHLMQPENCFHWEKWKDAFLGRLHGFHEWQNLHNIPSVKLNLSTSPLHSGVPEMLPSSKVISRNGWEPFRIEFCRFELESEGILMQRNIMSTFNSTSGTTEKIVYEEYGLARTKPISVHCENASLDVLRDGYQIVLSAIPYDATMAHGRDSETKSLSKYIHGDRRSSTFTGTTRLALEIVHNFLTEKPRKSLVQQIVVALESVVADVLADGYQTCSENWMSVLLNYSQNIVEYFGDEPYTCNRMPKILSPLWAREHPSSPTGSKILNILRTVRSMSGSYVVLVDHAWDLMRTVAQHHIPESEMASSAGGFQSLLFCQAVFVKKHTMESVNPSLSRYATYRLVASLTGNFGLSLKGDFGLHGDNKAEKLFIELGDNEEAPAMNAWALQIREYDPVQAEILFRRVIRNSNLDHAMYNLARLLVERHPESKEKLKEARDMFNSAIEQSDH